MYLVCKRCIQQPKDDDNAPLFELERWFAERLHLEKAPTAMKWYDLTAGTCRRQDTDYDFTGSIPGDALLIKMKGAAR